jgi:tetratricopeptide (TPR) repeat protein
MSNHEKLRSAIREAYSGRAILFLGAGAAKNAFKDDGSPLPAGQQLADVLAKDCGLPKGYQLDAVAEHYLEEKSETSLINSLRKHLTVANTGNSLRALAAVPWLRTWTTNYDNSFEISLKSEGRSHFAITTADDVSNARGNRYLVVHINGILSRLRQSLSDDFVLTTSSYATNHFLKSAWSTVFRNDINQARAIIVIGYSLADLDIARLIFDPEVYSKKLHFVDRSPIDPVLQTKLSRFGTVHAIGVDALGDLLEEVKSTWVAPTVAEDYNCWATFESTEAPRDAGDEDSYDLILKGSISDGALLKQIEAPSPPKYTAVRACESECMRHLNKDSAVGVLVGSFANGKTVVARSIALRAYAEGRDVFALQHRYDSAFEELQRLCRRERSFILILENYARHLDLVECFARYSRADCALLISERTELHELHAQALLEKLAQRDVEFFELDMLQHQELSLVSDLLDLRGLWGTKADLNRTQRKAFLKQECRSELQSILLEVVKSPQIEQRLSDIVSHFEKQAGGFRILLGCCLLQVVGEEPRIDVLSELLNLDYAAFRRLTSDSVVRQILSPRSGIISFRSPVIARAVLNGVSSASVVTDVAEEFVKQGHLARKADPMTGNIAKELMRFAVLERTLPTKGKRAALQNFYEEIKTVPTIRNNPHFWLQYAMARLSLGELAVARRYFEQSYAIARGMSGYDTFQIDNHFSRLLLREAQETSDANESFSKVDEALKILRKQVLRENRHYPFRSAWELEGVAKRHGRAWTDAQKQAVIRSAEYLISASTRLDHRVARAPAVVGGIERLRVVMEFLS